MWYCYIERSCVLSVSVSVLGCECGLIGWCSVDWILCFWCLQMDHESGCYHLLPSVCAKTLQWHLSWHRDMHYHQTDTWWMCGCVYVCVLTCSDEVLQILSMSYLKARQTFSYAYICIKTASTGIKPLSTSKHELSLIQILVLSIRNTTKNAFYNLCSQANTDDTNGRLYYLQDWLL